MDGPPLSPDHRRHVEDLIARRARVAWRFSTLGAFTGLAGVVLMLKGNLHSRPVEAMTAAVCLLVVVSGLVWGLGWRRVVDMRHDLADGRLATVVGRIDRIDRAQNAYGETLTRVVIGGRQHTTRDGLFEGFEEGERVAVDQLPRSRVPLAVRHA